MHPDLPSGTVTFLFTDIEASTQLWETHPEAMKPALARHDELLRAAVETHQGQVIKTTGDGVCAVFASALDSVAAVIAGQRALQGEPWHETGPLRVRMALHTGEAELRDRDDFGGALNRVARLMAVGAGGQILASQATAVVIQDRLPAAVGLLDLGEHRLKDLVRPEHIFQILVPDLPAAFPPLRSLNLFPNNLPVQLTSFVGREKEIAETRRLLAATRLLTLTGPGGIGKTRLALQIAAEALPDFPDGGWLVELASLTDPSYLMPALAATFHLRETPDRPLASVVTDYLRAKTLLLILDNCEHLIEACARLTEELLHACPHMKIIASSREALGMAGETVFRVPSLALPAAETGAPESLTLSEAVRLFVERALAVQPRFTLTPANTHAVAAIVHRLDGIPLALELAAARINMLTPDQIASRLDDRFRLLVGGSRTALPRQQTLQAMIDWSYDHLTEDERRLLRQLSVFVGGWTLEAAEAVGEGIDVLDLMARLVNKSLVTVDDQGAEARYRLLETIRQYARDKLFESGEATAVRNRHLAYFLHLTEVAEPRLQGRDMVTALEQLEVEQDNLRAALEWALDNDPLAALRMVAVLHLFWGRRASMSEGKHWVQTALARPVPAPPPASEAEHSYQEARAGALVAEATLAFALGDSSACRAAAEAGIAIARQINSSRVLASALCIGAPACVFQGDLATARAWSEECMALCRQHGFAYELGMITGAQMFLALAGNELVQPGIQEETLRTARASGNPWVIALATSNVARVAAFGGNPNQAYAGFQEASTLFRDLHDLSQYNAVRSEIAHVLRRSGRYDEATLIYRETIRVSQQMGKQAAAARELECLAFIAGATGKNERSARLFGAAEALRETISSPMGRFERKEYDQAVSQLREHMDEKALATAWAQGHALTMEEAIAYALDESSPSQLLQP